MPGVTLLFQYPEQRPNGGIAGRVRQRGENFSRRGLAPGVKNIHDLALPAAELVISGLWHILYCAKYLAQRSKSCQWLNARFLAAGCMGFGLAAGPMRRCRRPSETHLCSS